MRVLIFAFNKIINVNKALMCISNALQEKKSCKFSKKKCSNPITLKKKLEIFYISIQRIIFIL